MIPLLWLTKLLLSHLLTDFILQPGKWIESRHTLHFRSPYLYIHGLITGCSALLFVGLQYWPYILVITATHILFDGWKSYRPRKLSYFILDQLLHLVIIFACWYHLFYNWQDVVM